MKGKEVHSGNIEGVSTKEKSKFPQDFFPEVRIFLNIFNRRMKLMKILHNLF